MLKVKAKREVKMAKNKVTGAADAEYQRLDVLIFQAIANTDRVAKVDSSINIKEKTAIQIDYIEFTINDVLLAGADSVKFGFMRTYNNGVAPDYPNYSVGIIDWNSWSVRDFGVAATNAIIIMPFQKQIIERPLVHPQSLYWFVSSSALGANAEIRATVYYKYVNLTEASYSEMLQQMLSTSSL
jgi:hypothetical protein